MHGFDHPNFKNIPRYIDNNSDGGCLQYAEWVTYDAQGIYYGFCNFFDCCTGKFCGITTAINNHKCIG